MNQVPELKYEADLVALADLAKALGHPARLRILQILAQVPGCVCGGIVQQLPLSQATVSQHLKELKRVGLIQGTINGPRVCYCLDDTSLAAAGAAFAALFDGVHCCPNEGECHVQPAQS